MNLIVITGPTGVGKTELCLTLAEHYGCIIINADSRQLFAEIPIGTAAPTAQQMQRVRHYFVGTHHVGDYYSASEYEQDVLKIIEDLQGTQETAILSGGSMMYIDAVCNGIDNIPNVDDDTRNNLKQRLKEEGLDALVEELHRLDPEYWEIVDRKNPRRILHAVEICYITGETYTSLRTGEKRQRPFNIIKVGLNRPREELYERINQRVLDMIEQGLEGEARSVYHLRHHNSLNTVGFKEMFAYFNAEIPFEEAVRQIQSNTRRYARKQLTWYKRDADMAWFSPTDTQEIIKYIDCKVKIF